MKLKLIAAALLSFAAPAHAAQIIIGTVETGELLEITLSPGTLAGTTTRFFFQWEGGTPDGGDLLNNNNWRFDEIYEGVLKGKDGPEVSGCWLPIAGVDPGACFGGIRGITATSTITSNSIEAFFTVPANVNTCASGIEGPCAMLYPTRGPSKLRASFLGAPTNYRIEWGTIAAVPEPATWAMLILGFGLVGASVRRRATPFQPA